MVWCISRLRLLGQKLTINEFVAFLDLANLAAKGVTLDHRSFVIISYALCGFANFSSIGIQIGGIGALVVLLWWPLYRSPEHHRLVSPAELAHIRSDPPDPPQKYPWSKMFFHRQTWAFALGKFLTDPIWWLYLFWIPDFLNREYKIDLKNIGLPLVISYGLMPLLDALIGEDENNPPESVVPQLEADRYYRWLTWATVPLHFVALIGCAWWAGTQDLSWWALVLLAYVAGADAGLGLRVSF